MLHLFLTAKTLASHTRLVNFVVTRRRVHFFSIRDRVKCTTTLVWGNKLFFFSSYTFYSIKRFFAYVADLTRCIVYLLWRLVKNREHRYILALEISLYSSSCQSTFYSFAEMIVLRCTKLDVLRGPQ